MIDTEKLRAVAKPLAHKTWKANHAAGYCDCGADEPHVLASECQSWTWEAPADVSGIFTIDMDEYFGLDNETADYIEAFQPSAILALLDTIDSLRAEVARLQGVDDGR